MIRAGIAPLASRLFTAFLAALTGALLLASCSTFSSGAAGPEERSAAPSTTSGNLSRVQQKLIEGAEQFVRTGDLTARGRSFASDCTGTVLAIYWYAGIDLVSPLSRYSGNGVKRLHSYLQDLNLIYSSRYPSPGDIIFWDNTYDRNGDGHVNDPYTHAGMVLSVAKDGTIEYVHYNYRRGVVTARMNLLQPHVYTVERNGNRIILNSPMRMKGAPASDNTLASELLRSFGKGYRIPRDLSQAP